MTSEAEARAIIEYVSSPVCISSCEEQPDKSEWCMPCRARAWLAAHPEPEGETVLEWDYLTFTPLPSDLPLAWVTRLGEWGRDGWELIGVFEGVAVLKRPRPATVEGRVSDGE